MPLFLDARRMWSAAWRHALALAGLASATAIWMLPVLRDATRVIPGMGSGDNLTFVWNLWWMRVAVHDPNLSFFHSAPIFYPFGADLTLHTHTALPAFLAAVIAPTASLLATQNVLIAIHLFLNCAVAYALAFSITRNVGGALTAAIIFGWSPYISAHLLGHFNLIAAWILPLTTLCALRAIQGSRAFQWFLGGTLAMSVYLDYYYAVYAVLIVGVIAVSPPCSFAFDKARQRRPWQRRLATALLAALLLDLLVILFVTATGGAVLRFGGARISLLSITNPLGAAWLLLALLVASWWAPAASVTVNRGLLGRNLRAVAIPAAILMVAAAPLLLRTFDLWRAGDYATQRYYWRSAPKGIDAATLVLGNPYGLFTGRMTITAYQRLGIDPIEQVGWIGPAAIVLCAIAALRRGKIAEIRTIIILTAVFLVWSLGPYLTAFGRSTAMILPTVAIRFVPLVSNARIPGRAFVVVYMGAAILSACAVAAFARSTNSRRRGAAIALAAAVALDYAPTAPPTFAPGHPAPYDAIDRAVPAGAVLELPLGLRDGFGETGRFDSRILYYQSFHERPVLGGFVARLPPSILRRYRGMPIIGSLLRLSEGASPDGEQTPDPQRAARVLNALEVRYIVVNRRTAPPELLAYVNAVLPVRPLAEDEERIVYEVTRGAP